MMISILTYSLAAYSAIAIGLSNLFYLSKECLWKEANWIEELGIMGLISQFLIARLF